MTSKTPTPSKAKAEGASGDDIQVVPTTKPLNAAAARTHRSPFGDIFEGLPSIFGHRWPEMFAGISGFEPMKVEEELDDDTYVIRAEIPGVDPDEGIDIGVDGGRLVISATREKRTEADEANDFRSEFHYGSFRRSMTLPKAAEADKITATYADGILEVTVPIDDEEPTGRKIPIKRSS